MAEEQSVLKVGIIGTGIFATDRHLPTFEKIAAIEPAACFNRSADKAAVFAKKAKIKDDNIFGSMEELIKSPSVDFVDALLPVQFNLDAVKLAVSHSKPICIEKPIAANLDQARKIVQLSESTEVPVLVLENWSYLKVIDILKEEILPKIGDIVSFTYNATGPWNESNKYLNTSWRLNPEHIGGYLSDGGVHQLALLTGVLGEAKSISAFTKQVRESSGADDILFSTMQMKSGVIGTFTYGSSFGATDKKTFFVIYGTKGSVTYDFSPSLARPTITCQLGSSAQSGGEKEVIEVELNDTFVAEFANFTESILSHDKSKIVSTPRQAFHHLAIVAAALKSSSQNGTSVSIESP